MKAQAMVKDRGRHTFIDKVKVRLVDSDYWAEVTNFGHKNVHVPEHYVRDYERLVMGGVWSQVDMRFEYDEESRGRNPFWIDKRTPIQIATFDLEEYRRAAKAMRKAGDAELKETATQLIGYLDAMVFISKAIRGTLAKAKSRAAQLEENQQQGQKLVFC